MALLLKKQASITWRSARQLWAQAAPWSAHRRKAGRVGSLPLVPWELRQGPTSLCAGGGTGCPAVSEGEVVSFGKRSALMESGTAMYDPEADFWEEGAMFLLGKSCSHRSAEAGAR